MFRALVNMHAYRFPVPTGRRHTAWDPGSPHPRLLRESDVETVLASGTDFARKFDARVDSTALDALDRGLGL